MQLHTIVTGEFQVNCLIVSGAPGQALIVDPGGNAAEIDACLRQYKLTVAGYLLTHGHVDHVAGLDDLYRLHPAPIGLHPQDEAWCFGSGNSFPPFYPPPRQPAPTTWAWEDSQTIVCAGLNIRILATPGHSPGSVCFYLEQEQTLLTGDTLFAGSVGRTDLPGGSSRQLADSLKRISLLPDTTRLCPGHGPASNLQEEKHSNFFLRSPQAF